ncbi:MAG: hypothetical protein QF915_05035 [Candidatus Woesearchaeota archaeon]|nr:hypothetical protein [Candidatus Woesearchaeota archaeon]
MAKNSGKKHHTAKKESSGSEHHVYHHLPQTLQVLVVIVGVIIAVAGLKMIQTSPGETVGKAVGNYDYNFVC